MDEERTACYVNFRNWLLGARCNPEESSAEYLAMRNRGLEEEKARLQQEKERLMEMLREQCQKDADDLQANSDGLY